MKLFIFVEGGCVQAVYADSAKVEVEVIDLDECESPEEKDEIEKRADEVQAEHLRVA